MSREVKAVLFAVILISHQAHAKCQTDWYVVSGTIYDESGNPQPNVQVMVTWLEVLGARRGETATDQDGNYKFQIPFYPYYGNGNEARHVCTAKLGQATLTLRNETTIESHPLRVEGTTISGTFVLKTKE